jgi:hypothetical protein
MISETMGTGMPAVGKVWYPTAEGMRDSAALLCARKRNAIHFELVYATEFGTLI